MAIDVRTSLSSVAQAESVETLCSFDPALCNLCNEPEEKSSDGHNEEVAKAMECG